MKAIIYAGIGLFSVASVYGVADYYSTQKKGTLDKMYQEDVVAEQDTKSVITQVDMPLKKDELNSAVDKNIFVAAKVSKKIKTQKRTIKMEDFSRGRIDEPIPLELLKPVKVIKAMPVRVNEERMTEKKAVTETYTPVISTKEPERKLSLQMFSRAPLRYPAKTRLVKNGKE